MDPSGGEQTPRGGAAIELENGLYPQAAVDEVRRQVEDSPLYNKDLAPVGPAERTWSGYNLAALWIGISVVVTTYTLASGLMSAGMNWWQALLTVSLGNLLVLLPMLLNAHAGTRYGIPFPVFVRSMFGTRGANFAAMSRALVACGWFGIQTWIGATAIDALITTLDSRWPTVGVHQAVCFAILWIIEVAIILRGVAGIRLLESMAAPLLLAGGLALLVWAFHAGGGVAHVFSASQRLQQGHGHFWSLFWPGLAANFGYWATLSLNIPDFTRFVKSQRAQLIGQSTGLPLTMTAFSFLGIAVTAATVVIYGKPVWDPVALLTRLLGGLPVLLVIAMVIVVISQVSTNMAANVVSPSNDFSNLAPKVISFRMGGLITAVIGVVSFPWLLYRNAGSYIFTWLDGYGSLLAAIAAVMIVDYWIVRRGRLDLADLYRPDGRYAYLRGWNLRAIAAVVVAVVPVLPGFIHAARTPGGIVSHPDVLDHLYSYGVFFTFFVAAAIYYGLSVLDRPQETLDGVAETSTV
jgi:NCS1 family nucleobase:cation symporter-1